MNFFLIFILSISLGAGDYHIEKSDKYIVSSAPKYTFGVKKYSGLSNSGETPGKVKNSLKFSNSEQKFFKLNSE